MKTIVVYRSKTGFTKRYAKWIAEATDADVKDAGRIKSDDLMRYDTIVFGGALYAGGINGISLIKKNLWRLKGKKVIVFTLGATPVRADVVDEVRDSNFNEKEQRQIRFFMLRGGFDYSKLSLADKFLMTVLKVRLKHTKEPTADQRGMLRAYGRPADFTSRKSIAPIVEEILK